MSYKKGQNQNILYFHQFNYNFNMTNTKEHFVKFYSKSQKCILLRHFKLSRVYMVYNNEILVVEESIHAMFDDKEFDYEIPKMDEHIEDMKMVENQY